jgi:hypothetical protein
MQMKPIRELLPSIKAYLDLIDYNQERSINGSSLGNLDHALKRGIGDLDFDPEAYLATGVEYRDGRRPTSKLPPPIC